MDESFLANGLGYRYLFGDEPEKPETLAEERRERKWRIEDAEMKSRYPVIGMGVWAGTSLENNPDNNKEMDEPRYPVAGLAFVNLHLTENFGFALEAGKMAFETEKRAMYSSGFGYYYEDHDIVTTEFIVSVMEELSFPLGHDFQLDFLFGLYYGGHNYDGAVWGAGFETGANLRLTQGNHSFAAMFRLGQSFKEDEFGENEEILVLGGGYIYSFGAAGASEKTLPPPRYTAAAD
jgi:hypothetical protein